ncbi:MULTISPECIES: flagellar hook protein FlgE [unclassified Roseitalea]|uniref:flagellar hook protein FlgE n=1 Tax=unclassified Roseitalea TaxID=2639107 RepID=UPI00273DBB77|nr:MULTISPECIES: flagellar hook protein FlgE [unclassified Roseitalea]
MSLYGMMRTGVSGMEGQSNKLATVADNVANADTTGYKKMGVEFSSLVVSSQPNSHTSGGVISSVRQSVTQQGVLEFTSSELDLAVDGNGFFVVQDADGNAFMTRAGSFVPDGEGRLVNAAGYFLAGYSYADGEPGIVANSLEGMDLVRIDNIELVAAPSQNGTFEVNFPVGAEAATGPLPSSNAAGAEYTQKSSIVAYDNVGQVRTLDVYMTKTAADTWEVAVFDKDEAAPGAGFPYGSGPLATQTLTFDPANGNLAAGSATDLTVTVPGGGPLTLDLTGSTQLGADFTVYDVDVDGNPPVAVEELNIAADGTVYAQYTNETLRALFRIPLADVPSPDQLTRLSGNLYAPNEETGDVRVGWPQQGTQGSIVSGALEASNVDIAEELTEMIQAQRNYTANSKVFQTGSDLMDVLLTLKR